MAKKVYTAELPVDSINIDTRIERALHHGRAEQYAAHWDPIAAGTILVSRRKDGTYWVLDGQHRLAAAKMTGEDTIRAQVVEGLSLKDEGELRLLAGERLIDKPLEKFKVRVTMGEKEATEINKIVRSNETVVNETPDARKGINAIAAVERIYDTFGASGLDDTLSFVRQAFGGIHERTANGQFLRAVSWMLNMHHGEVDRDRLMGLMRDEGSLALMRRGQALKGDVGGELWTNIYRGLVQLYNTGLSKTKRLEVKTTHHAKTREESYV